VYDPQTPVLQRVKSRLSPESWNRRVVDARADELLIKRICREVDRGCPLNRSIAKVLPATRRSWAMRRVGSYRVEGFEVLIDARTPREPKVSDGCRQALQAARASNPRVTVTEAWTILQGQHLKPLPSEATIKREFARVDERRRYSARQQRAACEVVELPFAGGELLLAAEAETGGIAALTTTVATLSKQAKAAAQGQTPETDRAHRDRLGHFTGGYNRRRKRKHGEAIAAYLRSAAEKAEGRVPTWPRFVHERPETIDAKLRMLTFGWLVSTTKGWASLRSPEAAGLEALTGFAYMPSTLAKMVSALAISGAGQPLLETVGRCWHDVAQEHFDEAGAMAAIYIDNHAKEVWSSLFTQSGKVSHRNRVMPCITTTYAHTGAGTPVVLSVQSGSAPLAPRLVALVSETEKLLGGEVERAVVIDAEGSTFDLLESFTKRRRVLITPLRPARAPELELRHSRGSYFRPYREHDELRVASCTLKHRASGRTLDLGALQVRRELRDRKSDTVLLTNGVALGMEGRELADLYFRRWPVQENAFKEGAAAVALDQHRGNCGTMVANVAVITEMDQLAARAQRGGAELARLAAENAALVETAAQSSHAARRAQAALTTRRRRLDALVKRDTTRGQVFARAALEHQQALVRAEKAAAAETRARAAAERNRSRATTLEQKLAEGMKRRKHLEAQRTIRKLDVAQDTILTATKLTAMQLMTFALRVYLGVVPMTPETFVSRVFPIRGRKEIELIVERIIFYANPRDPVVTDALQAACLRLNQRSLKREGRQLHYAVEADPAAERFD